MPSPQRLYRHYSTPDLAAAFAKAKTELEECWQSVSGGAKSGTKAAQKMLQDQVAKANTSIYQAAQSQPQYAGMGTTLVVALFYDNKIMVAHIGDSRLYRMRGDEFSQVTKDHSLP